MQIIGGYEFIYPGEFAIEAYYEGAVLTLEDTYNCDFISDELLNQLFQYHKVNNAALYNQDS